jgi:hypothetical protein
MERWYKTLKGECIRVKTPLLLADARRALYLISRPRFLHFTLNQHMDHRRNSSGRAGRLYRV